MHSLRSFDADSTLAAGHARRQDRWQNRWQRGIHMAFLLGGLALLSAAGCMMAMQPGGGGGDDPQPTTPDVVVVLAAGDANDRGLASLVVAGITDAAADNNLSADIVTSGSPLSIEPNLVNAAESGAPLILAVGFPTASIVESIAGNYSNVQFVVIGDALSDSPPTNVRAVRYANDQVGYLAGVLAACVSTSDRVGIITAPPPEPNGSVISDEFITGFQRGARSIKPNIVVRTSSVFTTEEFTVAQFEAETFISQGVDVLFAVGGQSASGVLQAAADGGIVGIGADVDQRSAFAEVAGSLLTSILRDADVAAAEVLLAAQNGTLDNATMLRTLEGNRISVAAYGDATVEQRCRDAVSNARAAILADPGITGITR